MKFLKQGALYRLKDPSLPNNLCFTTFEILKIISESVFWKLRESEPSLGNAKTVESQTRKSFQWKHLILDYDRTICTRPVTLLAGEDSMIST